MKRINLTILVERPNGDTEKRGEFDRFACAWDAMEALFDGESHIKLVDGRGVTRSLLAPWGWHWK
jgi:hypothetical protein